MQHDRTEKKRRAPAWLNAILWSVFGVLGALLTICILTASLFWLVRWAWPAFEPPSTIPLTVTGQLANSTVQGDGPATSEGPAGGSPQISETRRGTATGDTATDGANTTLSPPASTESRLEALPTSTPTLARDGQDQSASVTSQAPDLTPGQEVEADTAGSPSPDSTTGAAETGDFPTGARETPDSTTDTGETADSPTSTGESPDATTGTGETPAASGSTAAAIASFTPSPSPTSTTTPTLTLTLTPTPIPLSPQEYIVQRDDWLSKLSDKFYGDILAYPAIVEATNAKSETDDSYAFIEDPDVIEIGQKLWIPTAEEAAALLADEE